jgi:DAACS family dicarboxylate/amino acid:cation (Na+ or H+) symporter
MSQATPLARRILVGLLAGIAAGLATLALGHFYPPALAFMQRVATKILDPFGQVFLRLLFFVIVPLVFASLASGVA